MHSIQPRGACHAFFEQTEFERLFRHDLLQVTGLFAQIFDFVSRGSTGRIASQSALPLLSVSRTDGFPSAVHEVL